MSPQLRMLLWKEWRERRAQFLVCLLWMVGGAAYNVAYEWSHEFRAAVAGFYGTGMLFGLFMPIFVAMRTSLGETTERTRSFTDALPISAQRRGWIRLAGGAAVLVAPILAGAVLISLCLALGWIEQGSPQLPPGPLSDSLPNRESLSAVSAVALVGLVTAVVAWSATALYVLVALFGTALRAEAHAGFVGAALAILWILGIAVGAIVAEAGLPAGSACIGAIVPQALIIDCTYGDARGSWGDLWTPSGVLGPLLANALIQLALAAWFVRRYSRRLPGLPIETVRQAPRLRWRPRWLPLPNRLIALAWLTLRQSVPMCLPGLVLACLMTPIQMSDTLQPRGQWLQTFADALPSSMLAIGLLWAVVVGAGAFSAEIDWRVGEFWRTQPIPFWRFFAAKFFVGLLAVLLVLDATTIAVSWNSAMRGSYESMNWPYIACIVPLHSVMFAVAVACTCALRRPVLGGMAAIGSFVFLEIVIEWSETTRHLDPVQVYNNLLSGSRSLGQPIDFAAHGYPVVAAAMGVVFLASIVVGGLALQRYDPRRQSG